MSDPAPTKVPSLQAVADAYGIDVRQARRLQRGGAPLLDPDALRDWLDANQQSRGKVWWRTASPEDRHRIRATLTASLSQP